MSPGPHGGAAGCGQSVHESEDGVRVSVGPATDRVHRRLDVGESLADRAVLPVCVPPLVAEPAMYGWSQVVEPGQPHPPPRVADHLGIGRQPQIAQEARAPLHLVVDQASPGEVHVVAIAIVGGADGDDRLQRRRAQRRDLQRGETTPGQTDHADGPVAPALRRDPGNRLHAVVPLLPRVFVLEQPVRVTRAAQVDAQAGVAPLGEVTVHRLVARTAEVATPVRYVLHHRGDLSLLRACGKPYARGQPVPVGHGDPRCLDFLDIRRKRVRAVLRFHWSVSDLPIASQ